MQQQIEYVSTNPPGSWKYGFVETLLPLVMRRCSKASALVSACSNKLSSALTFVKHCSVLQCVAVCCSVMRCVAVCCSVLQCVAVCCGVLQYELT